MDNLYNLNDLKELAIAYSGNENPNIFLLSDLKRAEESHQAFPPTNIFIDDEGDIIIQFDKKLAEEQ